MNAKPSSKLTLALVAVILALSVPALAAGAGPVDPAKTDVCVAVPGEAVAAAFGGTLRQARPFRDPDGGFARCTYFVAPKGGGKDAAYTLWLYPDTDYDDLLAVTERPLEAVKGLGDAAVLFQDEDGRWKLRFVVRGRYTLEATAADAGSARRLAGLGHDHL